MDVCSLGVTYVHFKFWYTNDQKLRLNIPLKNRGNHKSNSINTVGEVEMRIENSFYIILRNFYRTLTERKFCYTNDQKQRLNITPKNRENH